VTERVRFRPAGILPNDLGVGVTLRKLPVAAPAPAPTPPVGCVNDVIGIAWGISADSVQATGAMIPINEQYVARVSIFQAGTLDFSAAPVGRWCADCGVVYTIVKTDGSAFPTTTTTHVLQPGDEVSETWGGGVDITLTNDDGWLRVAVDSDDTAVVGDANISWTVKATEMCGDAFESEILMQASYAGYF
jgi:hypothetical protein